MTQAFPFHIGKIFVFGSNLAGAHGAGAALEAKIRYGAKTGQGVGLQGWSYAIPTKDRNIKTLPLADISLHVSNFTRYAYLRDELQFFITPIGTGLAGYSHEQIAPLFVRLRNCEYPPEWKDLLP